ncbi:MAG: glycosyltransferase family 4 protein [Gammaproteobacteria bacterium]|nr:glycosyltransferase family 4 protein [Gammaproteobacteria bacterium]
MNADFILADARWTGTHGIGRFSYEILSRLQHVQTLNYGPSPLSIKNVYWLPYQLTKLKKRFRVFFSPGFMPPGYSSIPFVFTIHDLIHLHIPGNKKYFKIIYDLFIKPAAHRAHKIITVSEYSKHQIMTWANIKSEKISVVKNGVSKAFSPDGDKHFPGYSYFLYVGNSKAHKNLPHLIKTFSHAKIDSSIKLILITPETLELKQLIAHFSLQNRIIFSRALDEKQLSAYYRGAMGLLFPSLYEGFGFPVVEAMACGTPVITSNVTSLPEIAGDAAICISPLDTDALAFHIEQMVTNNILRKHLIAKGIERAKTYSWDKSADVIQKILNEIG